MCYAIEAELQHNTCAGSVFKVLHTTVTTACFTQSTCEGCAQLCIKCYAICRASVRAVCKALCTVTYYVLRGSICRGVMQSSAPVRAAGAAPGGRKAVGDGEGAQAQVLNSQLQNRICHGCQSCFSFDPPK